MATTPRMTRLEYDIDNALQKFAGARKWKISFAIAQILANSPEISSYLDEKNREVA